MGQTPYIHWRFLFHPLGIVPPSKGLHFNESLPQNTRHLDKRPHRLTPIDKSLEYNKLRDQPQQTLDTLSDKPSECNKLQRIILPGEGGNTYYLNRLDTIAYIEKSLPEYAVLCT
jgi:hypothetical protein